MEINQILQQIDSLKTEADKLKPVKPESEKAFWNKFRLEFDYNSNHLEGNTLTYGHTQLLLLFDKVGSDDYSLRELEEMKAHDVALKIVKEESLNKEHQLTEKFIKELNEIILVRPFYKEAITPDGQLTRRLIEPGQYKKHPNSVRLENGEIFNYALPEETKALMGDLIEWCRKEEEKKELHIVQLAALFHYRFVRIHPFDDSNGRTARLVMNYILMKNGFASSVIESIDKRNYLTALNKADTGEIESFVDYISRIALRWQELYLKAIKGEIIEEPEDFDKEVELLKRNLSQNKGPEIEISEQIVNSIFVKSLMPLFRSVEQKLKKFKDLFSKSNIYLNASAQSKNFENLLLLENSIELYANHFKNGGQLQITFNYQGFKKNGTNVFNIYPKLTIDFNPLFFAIQINTVDNNRVEKFYDQALTENEIEWISQKIAHLGLEEIKKNLK